MIVNVVGLGYIGLPTSLVLAANGTKIIGTDVKDELVCTLENGSITFEESGLQELFNMAQGNIKFSNKIVNADVYIVTVPTPYIESTKKIDPTYLIDAVKTINNVVKENAILVIESTVSPGTIDREVRPLIDSDKIDLVHAPERILPGAMIQELITNSRTVGCDSEETGMKIKQLYETFCKGDIVLTDIKTAEMSKVVENTFRDINIAFANELTKICHEGGLDVNEVIRIANKHPRVNILSPGPGVGGHCISVDPWFLVGDYPELTNLILSARNVNDSMPLFVLERIKMIMKSENITDYAKVGVYGITYKENVDDIRESPTLQLISQLSGNQKNMRFYDPMVKKETVENQYTTCSEFLDSLELLVVLVKHDELSDFDLNPNVVIFDTKNHFTDLKIDNKIYTL